MPVSGNTFDENNAYNTKAQIYRKLFEENFWENFLGWRIVKVGNIYPHKNKIAKYLFIDIWRRNICEFYCLF